MDETTISHWIDNVIDQYPSGYVEVMASVSVQIAYLSLGLCIECIRPRYHSETSLKMLVQSLWNHAAATAVHILYVASRHGESVLTQTFNTRPYKLPSWTEVLGQLAVALVLRDVLFYTIHRLWHVPKVYQLIHTKHHEVLYPSKHHIFTISYMSMTDFLFLYGLPVMAVAKFLEMNIITTMAFALVSAVGEQIKLILGNDGHDSHHLSLGPPYGVYFIDDLLGVSFLHTRSLSSGYFTNTPQCLYGRAKSLRRTIITDKHGVE